MQIYHPRRSYIIRINTTVHKKWSRVIVVECQFSNFSTISWREKVNFQWNDDEVRFVLEQHAELHSDSSLKQQSADKNVAPLGHIILIPSQEVFVFSP